MNLFAKQRLRRTEETKSWLPEGGGGEGYIRINVYTLLYIKQFTYF